MRAYYGRILEYDIRMSIVLTINGIDKTKNIDTNSIAITNILTRKRDTCSFRIITHTGDSYVPALGREVIITDGAVRIFGGVVTDVESQALSFGAVNHTINCQDFTRILDKRLVPDAFKDQTVNQIIQFLKDNYFPSGFTITNVVAPVTIRYIAFNYKPLAKCIEELADLINYDWYVDYYKNVYFFAKETLVAPFDITDANGKYIYDSLLIRKDNSQVRNVIYVRGGEYLAAQTTYDILTNGVDTVYPSPYKLTDFAGHLTGEILNVGIDNLDNPDLFDALYNFNEKILKFKTADKPNANKTLKMSGKPNLPVIVKYQSSEDIAAMVSAEGSDGIYEYLIEDKSIDSKEGARQRARAEIMAYGETLSEGEFTTETSGLKAGQKINVSSLSRGISEDFIINKVVVNQFGKDTMIYSVSLITTRTFDLIDILQKLLLQSTKQLAIDENETIDIVENFQDDMTFIDSIAAPSVTTGPYLWDGASAVWNFSVWA